MIIHTHNPKLVAQYLEKLDLTYSIKIKKTNDNEQFKWFGLPEFKWDSTLLETTYFDIKNNLLDEKKRKELFEILNVKQTKRSYIHFEKKEKKYQNYEYEITKTVNPRYPIYVLSKGRWNKRYTTDSLEKMNCPYKLVIEPDEYDNYVKHVSKDKILVLPQEYLNKNQGGIPARNFIWQHSIDSGFRKHWVLDDNINGFYRWNYNMQLKIHSGVVFRVIEDYVKRYKNIGLVAMNYYSIIPSIHIERTMIVNNTRCYSCILVNTKLLNKKLNERWRGKYNEDTDLSIRVLKKKINTMLFNNFLCDKQSSGTMAGGNTDTIYQGGSLKGYQDKYDSLFKQHPDVVKSTNKKHKDGRTHHIVNYKKIYDVSPELIDRYKNTTEFKSNEYNMLFIKKN